ncbi:hypothetical protein AB0K00_02325 [Dactylosporangium sp. NPDC049525]|uniref:hypothetical protein n=1 Tax=Dactylosporangium sp. NPDC049525 TaxID=3154730 RepID=UPI0034351AAB
MPEYTSNSALVTVAVGSGETYVGNTKAVLGLDAAADVGAGMVALGGGGAAVGTLAVGEGGAATLSPGRAASLSETLPAVQPVTPSSKATTSKGTGSDKCLLSIVGP